MKIRLEFSIDNAAFEENPSEIESIFRRAARVFEDSTAADVQPQTIRVRDSNGNTVGAITVADD